MKGDKDFPLITYWKFVLMEYSSKSELYDYLLKCGSMYESLECCNMCFSVAYWAGIPKIVYACRKTPEMVKRFYYEGNTDNRLINETNNRKIELVFIPDFEQESLAIVKSWEKQRK